MRVVALDLSLCATGVAVQGGAGSPELSTLEPPAGTSGVERLDWIMCRVCALTDGADVTVLEGYAFARPNQAHQLGELGGVVRLALHRLRRPYVEVAPTAVKKFATGKGNAPKAAVLVEAVKRLGYEGSDHNVADALWLLNMARLHYELPGAVDVPQTHRAAMEKVDWPAVPAEAVA